jgi:hypothetical protein
MQRSIQIGQEKMARLMPEIREISMDLMRKLKGEGD